MFSDNSHTVHLVSQDRKLSNILDSSHSLTFHIQQSPSPNPSTAETYLDSGIFFFNSPAMLFIYYLLVMYLSLSLYFSPTTVKLGWPFKNTNIMSPFYFKYFNVSSLPSRQSQKFFPVARKYDTVLWTDRCPPRSDPGLCSAWLGATLVLVFRALWNHGFLCHDQDYLIFFSIKVFINSSAFAQGTFPCSFLKI